MILECSVSLPQKTSSFCRGKRKNEVLLMRSIWNLKANSHGFALLDMPTKKLILLDLLNPFTRFYFEEYLQTVLASSAGLMVYNGLVRNITDKESDNFDYQFLSTFFEMSAYLGGVRLTFCLFACACVCLRLCQTTTILLRVS